MTNARYYAAACQPDRSHPPRRDQIGDNVTRMLEMVDMAVEGYAPFFPIKLLVFPEFSITAPLGVARSFIVARPFSRRYARTPVQIAME